MCACSLLQALQAMGPVLQQHMMAGPGSSRAPAQQQVRQQPAPFASKISGPDMDDKQVRCIWHWTSYKPHTAPGMAAVNPNVQHHVELYNKLLWLLRRG